ncbi:MULTISPECIES: MazG nucleotide pyrophosphohydrolase domain-containing protein [Corynebacterium]|uniref:MazG nucleotide pyrophosphohydrolase domain-containing protein n=1 Tax=Corynebacterium TaxID=1716 RepID=UPI000668322B|nr:MULTISPECIES: MazG nucleotide pyrophosphohydrolase domain-containing protein [Corynebacterium]MDU4703800.1 MazG nucleotide pyrophosphohydrolase domain-containing protein [Corynebacterium sp.]MBC6793739.1 nucleoside triphosphate hydrolase [Corynebacterium sp. LK26]MBC6830655.1 nucleoside triphosphate hydrolase [Corynebacterium sp. LK32]MCA0443740.1 nucleoside triphosphate hydrolase [Corynebacterium amycolatum]MDK7200244.1 MazG nucleotide pyrophosphohydrolase domain-containing protein [Coryne
MTIIKLDSRFPTAIPLEAASLLTGEVSYTEEVPIRVRWAIADAGGHSVSQAEILVTTDMENDEVLDRLDAGEKVYSVELDDAQDPAAPAAQVAAAPQQDSVKEPESEPVAEPGAEPVAEPLTPQEQLAAARLPHVVEAVDIMAAARRTGQWEARQTHKSLLPYLIEETYEFVDAVNEGGDIRSELSDLLLQILFHAEIAEDFDFDDVATDFILKMRARQPYLFDGTVAEGEMVSEEEQERLWAYGRGRPRSNPATQLPALTLAEEAIRRARALGLSDADIPVEILVPTPGLETESGAEERTRQASRAFLTELAQMENQQAGSAEQWAAGSEDNEEAEDFGPSESDS